MNKLKHFIKDRVEPDVILFLGTVFFVYIAVLYDHKNSGITKEAFAGLTIVMGIFGAIYLNKDRLFKKNKLLYFVIQGMIIFDCATIVTDGFEVIFLGLLPFIMVQCIHSFQRITWVIGILTAYSLIFITVLYITGGAATVQMYLPILILLTVAVWFYYGIVISQLELRKKLQKSILDLELANTKVAQLSREAERNDIAREMHDILSQGLSALVLKLEAAQANFELDKIQRGKEIVSITINDSKTALDEARDMIRKLRHNETTEVNFYSQLNAEISRFTGNFTGTVDIEICPDLVIPNTISEQLLMILREGLDNIVKHAHAKSVTVHVFYAENHLMMKIVDDGIGFNPSKVNKLYGHFGLIGMQERVSAINGDIEVVSLRKQGTSILVRIGV